MEHVPLGPLTTFGVGGAARYAVLANDESDVASAVRWARARDLPLFVLGYGSNTLVADAGFEGLVIRIAMTGWAWRVIGDEIELTVAAGHRWDALVTEVVERGWAGIECLAGIPGLVGAAPVQNIGAYGQELADVVIEVRVYDMQADRVCGLPGETCGFGYRTSRFKGGSAPRFVILGVTIRLRVDGAATLRYGPLRQALADSCQPSLAAVRRAVLDLRRAKSMVLEPHGDPADPNARSAGSFFTNPIVAADCAAQITANHPSPVPQWPEADGRVKLSAAWLIEQSGFYRGYQRGRAAISSRHALALVSRDRCAAQDIARLASEIRKSVRDRFGIRLQPEPVFVGWGASGDRVLD